MLQHSSPAPQHLFSPNADSVTSVERTDGPWWKRPMPRVSSMLFDLEVRRNADHLWHMDGLHAPKRALLMLDGELPTGCLINANAFDDHQSSLSGTLRILSHTGNRHQRQCHSLFDIPYFTADTAAGSTAVCEAASQLASYFNSAWVADLPCSWRTRSPATTWPSPASPGSCSSCCSPAARRNTRCHSRPELCGHISGLRGAPQHFHVLTCAVGCTLLMVHVSNAAC